MTAAPAIELVRVPGGSFEMGDLLGEGTLCERPVHRVSLRSFEIGRYLVTQRQWIAVTGANPSRFPGDDYPVEQVSFDDCREFIARLNELTEGGYRLPTEAEWEYAARSGGRPERYAGSMDDLDRVAWWKGNSGGTPKAVGLKAPNGLGLFDMSGNVWEWCADWFDAHFYERGPAEDPMGPERGDARVCRGGCRLTDAMGTRCAYRSVNGPDFRYDLLGFRLARDAR